MKKWLFGVLALCCFVLSFVLQIDLNKKIEVPKNIVTVPVPLSTTLPIVINAKNIRNIQLDSNQVINLTGEVGPNVDDIINQLNKLNKQSKFSEIYLLIDSPGGSVLDGAKLVSAIEASKTPVITVCTAICASMAAIIHQYGVKRLMIDRSALMFHDAAGGLQGPLPQMRSRLNFFDRLTAKMDAFIAKRVGMELETFLTLLHSEIWLDAEDSTKQHFNDEIVFISIIGLDEQIHFNLNIPDKSNSKLIDLKNITVK
jgi:ATP-dependent Clp protease protease subunit